MSLYLWTCILQYTWYITVYPLFHVTHITRERGPLSERHGLTCSKTSPARRNGWKARSKRLMTCISHTSSLYVHHGLGRRQIGRQREGTGGRRQPETANRPRKTYRAREKKCDFRPEPKNTRWRTAYKCVILSPHTSLLFFIHCTFLFVPHSFSLCASSLILKHLLTLFSTSAAVAVRTSSQEEFAQVSPASSRLTSVKISNYHALQGD